MNTLRIRTLLTCIATIVGLLAILAPPALAEHKGETHGQQEAEDENFQEADAEASDEEAATSEDSGSSRSPKKQSSTSDSSTSDEGTTTASSNDPSTTSEEQDGPGKNWDNEGSYRGESSTKCENTHGGTGSGRVYDSTCDGVASKAGNGGGTAGGRPCAGCVGNADYKEPAGQLKDGDHDGNAGYECDGNNGVARSNPAHTSCKLPPTTELCPSGTDLSGLPVPSTGCDLQEGQLCPPGTDLAGLPVPSTGCDVGKNELCPPGSDMAGRPPGPNGCNQVLGRIDKVCPEDSDLAGRDMTDIKDCVLGTRFQNSTPPGDEPLGAILPFTGSSGVSTFILLGLLLMGAGLLSLRLRKSA